VVKVEDLDKEILITHGISEHRFLSVCIQCI